VLGGADDKKFCFGGINGEFVRSEPEMKGVECGRQGGKIKFKVRGRQRDVKLGVVSIEVKLDRSGGEGNTER
jgi:hypothetical protein